MKESLLPEIETARLRLRTFRAEDVDFLYRLWTDPEVTKFFPAWSPTREMTASIVARSIERWRERGFGPWAIELKESEQIIGNSGLQYLDNTPEVEVAYMLDKLHWGFGFATEAARAALRYGFEEVKLERIIAITHPDNLASQNVMVKSGMKFEKMSRNYEADNVRFVISRQEYQPGEDFYILRRGS